MPRKKKPYMEIETIDDFNKLFDDIFEKGKRNGLKDGIAIGLSYFFDGGLDEAEETFQNGFDIRCKAMQIASNRQKAKAMKYNELLIKLRELEAKADERRQ